MALYCEWQKLCCSVTLVISTRGWAGQAGAYAEPSSSQNNIALCICNSINIAGFRGLSPLKFVLEPLDVWEVVTLDDSGQLRLELVIVNHLGR